MESSTFKGGKVEVTLQAQMCSLVDTWISKEPSRSVATLARVSGVNESTIRRLKNDKVVPAAGNAMKMLIALAEQKSALKAINHYDQTSQIISKYLKANFPMISESLNEVQLNKELSSDEILTEFNTYLVYRMTDSVGGTTKQAMVDILGVKANEAISALVKLDLIAENEGMLTIVKPIEAISIDLEKRHSLKCAELMYKTESMYNSFTSVSNNVNIEGAREIIRLMHETGAKVAKIMDEKPGKIPFMSIMFSDTMTTTQFFGKGK